MCFWAVAERELNTYEFVDYTPFMATDSASLDQLLALPPRERAQAALRLIESLDAEPDQDAEKAWANEILTRVMAVRSGAVATISSEDAMRLARERVRLVTSSR